jgi:hypothetical protein
VVALAGPADQPPLADKRITKPVRNLGIESPPAILAMPAVCPAGRAGASRQRADE